MKTGAIVVAISLVAILLTAARPIGLNTDDAAENKPAPWEYKVVGLGEVASGDLDPAAIERALNRDYGQKGWQLCAVDSSHAGYIFKRSKE